MGWRAVERLDLALLVDAQDDGALRRRHVEPDDVAHLGDEVGIGGELEGLQPVRLQAEGPPDALHRRGRQAARLGHAARTPMGGVPGRLSRVSTITASIRASSIVRGAPERGSSRSPSIRCSTKRWRHLPTVSGHPEPRRRPPCFCPPSAQASTIRARSASACAVLRRAASALSSARSASLSSNGGKPNAHRNILPENHGASITTESTSSPRTSDSGH